MKVLDLFSGIGGFSLGLERAGMETVAFCEFDEYARKVLKKHWPDVPIHEDVRELDGKQYRGSIDVVCGGFPCQDLSTAGRQEGIGAARSGLFYEMCRIIGECRPKYAIFENVTNLLNGGGGDWFTEVLCEISAFGYDAEWHCIPASELGAHHHRDRVWIIAYANSKRQQRQGQLVASINKKTITHWETGGLEHAFREGALPYLCRDHDGVSGGAHRVRQLGNAVVPQIPEVIGHAIMQHKGDL